MNHKHDIKSYKYCLVILKHLAYWKIDPVIHAYDIIKRQSHNSVLPVATLLIKVRKFFDITNNDFLSPSVDISLLLEVMKNSLQDFKKCEIKICTLHSDVQQKIFI